MTTPKLPYLVQELSAALEVYLSGRTGQQYNRTAFILCDDCAELANKLFLLSNDSTWSDATANGRFKNFAQVASEVSATFGAKRPAESALADSFLTRIKARRHKRNTFFHSTSLLDLNLHARDCVEAFLDLIDFGALLFPSEWSSVVAATGNMETCEAVLRLDRRSYGDPVVSSRFNAIIAKWPRVGPAVRKAGCEVAHYAEDLHLRLCIRNGGKELGRRLQALLS